MPLHMVRHSVTRHAKAPGAAEDVAEDAATVAELARAIKAERAKTQRAFERHLRRRVAEVATAKATEADELADEVANIALATVSGGGAGAGPTPPAAPTPLGLLLEGKAEGTRASHRALLAAIVPSAFGGGSKRPKQPNNAARVAGGENERADVAGEAGPRPATSGGGAGFVSKRDEEARAESERQRVKNARDAAARAERTRASRRMQRLASVIGGAAPDEVRGGSEEEDILGTADEAEDDAALAEARRVAAAASSRRASAERATRRARLAEALQEIIARELERKHAVLPPVCACAHAETTPPFHPEFVERCAENCPLRGDDASYRAALAQVLAAYDIRVAPGAESE